MSLLLIILLFSKLYTQNRTVYRKLLSQNKAILFLDITNGCLLHFLLQVLLNVINFESPLIFRYKTGNRQYQQLVLKSITNPRNHQNASRRYDSLIGIKKKKSKKLCNNNM